MSSERFLTPVGRLVQGSCFEAQTTDMQGNLRVVKTGPNAGQPNPQFFIAVAFPKSDAAFNEFYALLTSVAKASFPAFFPGGQNECTHPQFSWKVVDGDGIDTNGKPNNQKPGFAGCWVVRFSSGYAPRVFPSGHYQPHEQITDPSLLRLGYYVRVAGKATGNGEQTKPGLYLNFDLVELSGYGDEIVLGPDATGIFGSAPAALPAGASATPMTPAPGATTPPPPAAPAAPAAPAPGAATPPPPAAPAAPAPGAATPPPPAAPAAPAPGAATPPPPNTSYMAPPEPLAAPVKTMTDKANGMTYETAIGLGWTDELLIQHGMMVQ